MSKHTPGPWVALYDERRGNYQISSEAKGGMGHWIATTKCESVPAHHEANAHLIAAAPEMYEVVRLVVERMDADEMSEADVDDFMEAWTEIHEKARGAFAKATGDES